jgi:hypothetical protein
MAAEAGVELLDGDAVVGKGSTGTGPSVEESLRLTELEDEDTESTTELEDDDVESIALDEDALWGEAELEEALPDGVCENLDRLLECLMELWDDGVSAGGGGGGGEGTGGGDFPLGGLRVACGTSIVEVTTFSDVITIVEPWVFTKVCAGSVITTVIGVRGTIANPPVSWESTVLGDTVTEDWVVFANRLYVHRISNAPSRLANLDTHGRLGKNSRTGADITTGEIAASSREEVRKNIFKMSNLGEFSAALRAYQTLRRTQTEVGEAREANVGEEHAEYIKRKDRHLLRETGKERKD